MPIQIQQAGPDALIHYASVPISFQVRSRLRATPLQGGLGGLALVEEPVNPPYIKDYDVDESPLDWPERFDIRKWAIFLARAEDRRALGAALVAYDTPGIHMLEGRRDLTVLWDLRVHPGARHQGIGAALFRAAAEWSRSRTDGGPVRQMKIETQDINVSACRFYAAQGAVLGAIHCYGYSNTPYAAETMLLWYKDL